MGCLFRIIKSFIVVFLLVIILVLARGFLFYKNALDKTPLDVKVSEITSNPNYVTIDNISDSMKKFIVTVEDKRFYTHSGIDISAIASSMVSNLSVGYYKYGGSTITQQLAKNMYFSNDKNITRKIAEMFTAFKIEREYSKDKILEMYLNQIYFGHGYYGINSASYGYFGVSPKDLTRYQSSLLAGIPQSPSTYDLKNKNKSMGKRYSGVLRNLLENEDITIDEAKKFEDDYKAS